MEHTIVAAYLMRVERPLTVIRPPARRGIGASGGSHQAHPLGHAFACQPAVLVIPRHGGLRDPYVIVLGEANGGGRDVPLDGLITVDVHVVAGADKSYDREWREAADVLICPRRRLAQRSSRTMLERLLDHHPGCDIVVGSDRHGCLLALRDGRTVEVTGAPRSVAMSWGPWAAVYGSMLHCWLAAGIPFGPLQGAFVIVGSHNDDGGFSVAGRAQICALPTGSASGPVRRPNPLHLKFRGRRPRTATGKGSA
jgi:hypothetical protein